MTEPPPSPHDPGDAPDLDRVVRALRDRWAAAPEADRSAIWQAIEGQLGPQDDPRRDRGSGFLGGIVGGFGGLFHGPPLRQVVIAGAAVFVAGALVLGGAFQSGTDASAAVLERVDTLSRTTTDALADDALSADEILALRDEALRLLASIEDDDRALHDLTPEQLAEVIDTLQRLLLQLEGHDDDDDDLLEAVSSIRRSSEHAESVRREYEDDDGDDDTPAVSTPLATGSATPGITVSPSPTATAEPDDDDRDDDDDDRDDDDDATPSATAAPGTSATPSTTATPASTATPGAGQDNTELIPATAGTYTRAVGQAGSVTFSYAAGQLSVDHVFTAAGWSATVDQDGGSEIRVRFSSGVNRATFDVERDDGLLEIDIDWSTEAS
jgi:hypothetical protein